MQNLSRIGRRGSLGADLKFDAHAATICGGGTGDKRAYQHRQRGKDRKLRRCLARRVGGLLHLYLGGFCPGDHFIHPLFGVALRNPGPRGREEVLAGLLAKVEVCATCG